MKKNEITTNSYGPELAEDQVESGNFSIGVGDKVRLLSDGTIGKVVYAEMVNNHQNFYVEVANGRGNKKIVRDVPEKGLIKINVNLEEETLP